MSQGRQPPITFAILLASVLTIAFPAYSEGTPNSVELPGERAFPESISAAPDGTLYVSSLASGGVVRIKPGASTAEQWIKPGAFDGRFDIRRARRRTLQSSMGLLERHVRQGSTGTKLHPRQLLKGFDLATGQGKVSAALPGSQNLCNDMAIAADGSIYVTNSRAPQILRLKPDGKDLEVFLEDKQFEPPKDGVGLDGIAIGGDGDIYVNTFSKGEFSASTCTKDDPERS